LTATELLREFEAAVKGMGLDELRALTDKVASGRLLDVDGSRASDAAGRSRRRPRRDDTVMFRVRADLEDAMPLIWRRLELRSDLYLDSVHQVLQAAFGWRDSHLHRFAIGGSVWDRDAELFLCPDDVENPEGFPEESGTPEEDVRLDEVLAEPGDRLAYVYDYGDDWRVSLRLEKILGAPLPDADQARCTDGRTAAPPDDSRLEYMRGGLAAVVDDPEHFDPAEVNDAMYRPWSMLHGRGFHPHVVELVNMMSFTDDGADLGPRLAQLTPDPPISDNEELADALGAFLWFLDQAGGDGIPLTAAGWMRPAVVEQAATRIPQMTGWIGKANREDLTQPVMHFRDLLIKQLGLLRKHKGRLLLTRAGAAARGRPDVLFRHLTERLTPPDAPRVFAAEANLLILTRAAVSPGEPLPLDKLADLLTYLAFKNHDGSPPRGHQLRHYDGAVWGVLTNIGAPPAHRSRERDLISPVAAALAHAALIARTT
jgi:hypothetical protein